MEGFAIFFRTLGDAERSILNKNAHLEADCLARDRSKAHAKVAGRPSGGNGEGRDRLPFSQFQADLRGIDDGSWSQVSPKQSHF